MKRQILANLALIALVSLGGYLFLTEVNPYLYYARGSDTEFSEEALSGVMLIPVKIGDIKQTAIIDTGASLTVIPARHAFTLNKQRRFGKAISPSQMVKPMKDCLCLCEH